MSAHTPDVPGTLAGADAMDSALPDLATAAESEAHALGRTLARRLEGVGTLIISMLDVGMAALAWYIAHSVRIGLAPQLGPLIPFTSGSQAPPWLPEGVFLALYALSLYGNGCLSSERPLWVLRRQLLAGAGALFVFLVLSYLFKWLTVSRAFLAVMGIALPVAIVFEWFVIRAFRKIGRHWGIGINRVLVAGDTLSASWVLHDLERNASWGIRAIGLVSDDAALLDSTRRNVFNVRVVPGVTQVASWAVRLKADQVVLCLPDVGYAELAETIQALWKQGVRVYVLRPELSVHLGSAEEPQSLFRGTELVDYGAWRGGPTRSPQKRAFDLLVGTLLLLLALPVLAAIAIAILITDGGPVLHRQVRCGHGGRRFTIWKFRTMKVGAESLQHELMERNEAVGPMFKIRKDPRLTPIGAFLRRHSLDELPQLVNVLFGEMSLVGPRPPLPSEVERYQPWHHSRLSGVIGCSGLWQVSGRSELPFDEMVMLDLYYLRHSSLRLDCKILTRTLWVVLVGEGAY